MSRTTIHGEFPGHKLEGAERYKRLYHFTSFDAFVKIWLSKTLRFGPVYNVNDIQEIKDSVSITDVRQMPLMYAYLDVINEYKQISLTMDYDSYLCGCMSTMMWGHYGDKGQGVCIQFDFDKLNIPDSCYFGPIDYVEFKPKGITLSSSMHTRQDLIRFIGQKKETLFFTKTKSWEKENEYRIISRDLSYLSVANAISAVYLTKYDSVECKYVEQLVNKAVPVKCIKFISSIEDDRAIPILVDTEKERTQMNEFKQHPSDTISLKASRFYEQHKGSADFPLLMDLNELMSE